MISDENLPGLYKAADKASMDAQRLYFLGLICYLLLLILAAAVSHTSSNTVSGAIWSTVLFLVTLSILIALQVTHPENIWYNGRAVAESVKTRSWRWIMRAEPYIDNKEIVAVSKSFINDLKKILDQNTNLATKLPTDTYLSSPISDAMREVRALDVQERLNIYQTDRVDDQADWYSRKTKYNRNRSLIWFWVSVVLHMIAVVMLLYGIKLPSQSFPIGVVSTAASAVLTWLQAKKHKELAASFAHTAHEITLIKGEALSIIDEIALSDYVVNTENAFSREHTQWVAKINK